MQRLYVSCKSISAGKINICDRKQLHYLKNVLRVKLGEKFMAFDEKGREYISEVKDVLPESITLLIKSTRSRAKAENLKITVACAIPKKSKMDDIVDKLTQLGVDRIMPLDTERVIAKLDNRKKADKHSRWRKIALSAAQQSQRNTIAVIEPIQNIKKVLANSNIYDLKLIPTLEGSRKSLKEIVSIFKPRNILIFIGPEGDFTGEEVAMAIKCGCIPITLGEAVLRVETAAIAVVSFLRLNENH